MNKNNVIEIGKIANELDDKIKNMNDNERRRFSMKIVANIERTFSEESWISDNEIVEKVRYFINYELLK